MLAANRLVISALFLPLSVLGATIGIGLVSFDSVVPGTPGNPGVNGFSISNFTGDPSFGGWAIPPDFPVFSSLVFLNPQVILFDGSSTQTVLLPSFSPGSDSPVSLQFLSEIQFVSATFTATLSQTSLQLSDGSTFLSGATVAAQLSPSNGQFLEAGTDFAVLSVSEVPEPATLWVPGLCVLFGILAAHRRRALAKTNKAER